MVSLHLLLLLALDFSRPRLCASQCTGCAQGGIAGDCTGTNPAIGCFDFSLSGKIYGCCGNWSEPGLAATSGDPADRASALCASGYEICPSASRAYELGMRSNICGSTQANLFFGSLQSGTGNLECSTTGTDDIFGCSQQSGTNPVLNTQSMPDAVTECEGTFVAAVSSTSSWATGWSFTGATNEVNTAVLNNPKQGGVLCCKIPTPAPTDGPSKLPTSFPSNVPSRDPTRVPSISPSAYPTVVPSKMPSADPTIVPSLVPSSEPTSVPSMQPSNDPSAQPSVVPSEFPTRLPSEIPSAEPTKVPIVEPSNVPSEIPSSVPSAQPVQPPTSLPTNLPTSEPTPEPIYRMTTTQEDQTTDDTGETPNVTEDLEQKDGGSDTTIFGLDEIVFYVIVALSACCILIVIQVIILICCCKKCSKTTRGGGMRTRGMKRGSIHDQKQAMVELEAPQKTAQLPVYNAKPDMALLPSSSLQAQLTVQKSYDSDGPSGSITPHVTGGGINAGEAALIAQDVHAKDAAIGAGTKNSIDGEAEAQRVVHDDDDSEDMYDADKSVKTPVSPPNAQFEEVMSVTTLTAGGTSHGEDPVLAALGLDEEVDDFDDTPGNEGNIGQNSLEAGHNWDDSQISRTSKSTSRRATRSTAKRTNKSTSSKNDNEKEG